MKLSELARYWAAKELTQITQSENKVSFQAPFACPDYTVSIARARASGPVLRQAGEIRTLQKVSGPLQLHGNTWCEHNNSVIACFNLNKGMSELSLS